MIIARTQRHTDINTNVTFPRTSKMSNYFCNCLPSVGKYFHYHTATEGLISNFDSHRMGRPHLESFLHLSSCLFVSAEGRNKDETPSNFTQFFLFSSYAGRSIATTTTSLKFHETPYNTDAKVLKLQSIEDRPKIVHTKKNRPEDVFPYPQKQRIIQASIQSACQSASHRSNIMYVCPSSHLSHHLLQPYIHPAIHPSTVCSHTIMNAHSHHNCRHKFYEVVCSWCLVLHCCC